MRISFHILLCVSIFFSSFSGSVASLSELDLHDPVEGDNVEHDRNTGSDNDKNSFPAPITELEDTDDEKVKRKNTSLGLLSAVRISVFRDGWSEGIALEVAEFHPPLVRRHLLLCTFLV